MLRRPEGSLGSAFWGLRELFLGPFRIPGGILGEAKTNDPPGSLDPGVFWLSPGPDFATPGGTLRRPGEAKTNDPPGSLDPGGVLGLFGSKNWNR